MLHSALCLSNIRTIVADLTAEPDTKCLSLVKRLLRRHDPFSENPKYVTLFCFITSPFHFLFFL